MVNFKKSEKIYLQGKVSWFRYKAPNQWNKWSTKFHPNPQSLEKIRELQGEGLKNQLKKDEDGYYTTFSRPVTKETRTGKILSFKPVEVFDKDGFPFDGNVGNGSDVTLKIEVYGYESPQGKGIAARWESAKIENLVPFDEENLLPDEKAAREGLMEQPTNLF